MRRFHAAWFAPILVAALVIGASASYAQKQFTIEQVLSYAFPYELVSARKADRVAWLEFEQGKRNVYTAAAPDFKPVRLTDFVNDDGVDLTSLAISDDGAVVIFVRGHDPNREEWNANPSSSPDGTEQAIWAVRTRERRPFRLVAARNPVLSPDGKWVLFVKGGRIYEVAVPAAGKKGRSPAGSVGLVKDPDMAPLFYTWGTNSSPRWSPDSRKIAFVTDRRDHSFIGIYDHASRKITYISPSVDRDTNPAWSSDGKRIAFIRRPGLAFAQITALAQATRPPGIPGIPGFPGRPDQPPGRTAPQREQAPQKPPQPATGPGFQEAKFEDGHTLNFWVADVQGGKAERVWRDPLDDDSFRTIRDITWAGDSLVFQIERNNWRHYYAVRIAGGLDSAAVDLTPGEGEAESVGLSPDGKFLYYSANVGDIDRRHLWQTPTAGGEPVQLTKGDGSETYPSAIASGSKVGVLYADARHPQSVAVVDAKGGKAQIIRQNLPADFPLEAHVIPEQVILTAEDGLKFHNQLFLPKDIRPGERRPALLFSHGGPGRQMLLAYHYMFFYHMAYAMNQYFANKGYVVISVNYRSGIGYGREFRMAPNRGAAGSSEYQDIYAAGKYLQSRPDVDPDRIGLYGLSYGGLITAMGLSRNSDLFKAGVDIAGVHLWGNSLDTNGVSFKSSSVATVDKWTSPVLLIQGDDDRNVAFSQTTGLVQLLRARNVRYELIVFPDEVHDFLVFKRWLTTFNAADDFFNRFLRK
jgi:dipeptidyl aminopeptidase/acylaminoacyl peptidase